MNRALCQLLHLMSYPIMILTNSNEMHILEFRTPFFDLSQQEGQFRPVILRIFDTLDSSAIRLHDNLLLGSFLL